MRSENSDRHEQHEDGGDQEEPFEENGQPVLHKHAVEGGAGGAIAQLGDQQRAQRRDGRVSRGSAGARRARTHPPASAPGRGQSPRFPGSSRKRSSISWIVGFADFGFRKCRPGNNRTCSTSTWRGTMRRLHDLFRVRRDFFREQPRETAEHQQARQQQRVGQLCARDSASGMPAHFSGSGPCKTFRMARSM